MRSKQRVWRLEEIVARLGGELIGDSATEVGRVAPIERAPAGAISFVTNAKYRAALQATAASAVVVPPAMRDDTALPRIVAPNPYLYYARLVALLHADPAPAPGIHASAVVDSSLPASVWVGANVVIGRDVKIGEGVCIHPGTVIGDGAVIGENSVLHANVTVYADCAIGARAVIHSGAVIGSDGFGFAKDGDAWVKIPQVGRVLIGDDVEIGANTAIDRGALDDTVIGNCVKLDNLVHIAHNIQIGDFTAIAGCVGMAGSTRLGSKCTVGGGALIVGHIDIADGVNVSGGTVVTKSIAEKGTYTGFFPIDDHLSWMKSAAQIRHLVDTQKRVRELEKKLSSLLASGEANNP